MNIRQIELIVVEAHVQIVCINDLLMTHIYYIVCG